MQQENYVQFVFWFVCLFVCLSVCLSVCVKILLGTLYIPTDFHETWWVVWEWLTAHIDTDDFDVWVICIRIKIFTTLFIILRSQLKCKQHANDGGDRSLATS